MKKALVIAVLLVLCAGTAYARSQAFGEDIYNPGDLKPRDSVLKVKVGDMAPDFTLPAVSGGKVSLSD